MMDTLPRVQSPVGDANRIEIVDVLRGFAVCGILIVNIMAFKAPGSFGAFSYEGTLLNRLVGSAVIMLAYAKFFTLFSFLFGWGVAMQFLRAEQRDQGAGFTRLFLRRLLVLGLIGMVHVALLSEGDILLLYAVIGLLFLPLRRARPKILLRWVIWLLAISTAVWLFLFGALALGRAFPEGAAAIAESDREIQEMLRAEGQSTTAAYLDPSFSRQVATRLENYGGNVWVLLILGPTVLAMLMLGLAAGRRDLVHPTADHLILLRRVRTWGLGVGLPLALLAAAGTSQLPPLSALMVLQLNTTLVGPILAMAYCAGIALLWQRPGGQRLLRPLAALGRLALTNYLLQSVIATFLFYGHGLGLAGQVSPSLAVLITVAILAVQILGSGWWVGHYRFGPAEWLWRTLTYGRLQPMRRAAR